MFEKEADEYADNNAYQYANDFITCQEAFQKGAEFGYNKAKEEMQKNGLALQSDMDKTIEQNIQLKAQTYIMGAEPREKRIAELEKELKEAKELIRQLCSMVRALNKPNVQLTNVDYSLAEAEQFISEVEK